jgi:hypothetical protein
MPVCLVPNVTQFKKNSSYRLLKITDDVRILGHKHGDYPCYTPCTTEKAEVSFGKHNRQRLCEASYGTALATLYVVKNSS